MYWIAKNGIVFAYRQDLRPAAASGNNCRGELQISKKLGIEFAPRRGERQLFIFVDV
jgi:hypothetical protein